MIQNIYDLGSIHGNMVIAYKCASCRNICLMLCMGSRSIYYSSICSHLVLMIRSTVKTNLYCIHNVDMIDELC